MNRKLLRAILWGSLIVVVALATVILVIKSRNAARWETHWARAHRVAAVVAQHQRSGGSTRLNDELEELADKLGLQTSVSNEVANESGWFIEVRIFGGEPALAQIRACSPKKAGELIVRDGELLRSGESESASGPHLTTLRLVR